MSCTDYRFLQFDIYSFIEWVFYYKCIHGGIPVSVGIDKLKDKSKFLEENKIDVKNLLYKAPVPVKWGIYIVVIVLILFSSTRVGTTGGFMYANF